MSDLIRLTDHVFIRARRLLQAGQITDARCLLDRLVSQVELRVSLRAVAHQLLGQLDLAEQRYRRARRHFARAMELQPLEAECYWRYAAAVEADPDANPKRGWVALRKAIEINPFEPRYWVALGRSASRLGRRKIAIRSFRKAARLGSEQVEVLAEVVDGLVGLGRGREAAAVLTAARFRAPADPALRQLADRLRFDMVRSAQEAARRKSAAGRALLPFPGRLSEPAAPAGATTIVRVDRGSRPAPHVLRMFSPGGAG